MTTLPRSVHRHTSAEEVATRRAGLVIAGILGVVLVAGLWLLIAGLT